MKLNHKEITIQQYISEAIENDVVMYQKEQKTVLVVNDTAYAIWNAITNAAGEKRDITTEEIATSLCAQYSLGDDQFEEICKDVDGTLSAFFKRIIFDLRRQVIIRKG